MTRSPRDIEYINLGIPVDGYQVAAGKSININLLGDPASYVDNDMPVFTPDIKLEIIGMCICPESRANQRYEITIYNENAESPEPKVKDIGARNKENVPIYRKRRDREIPVYNLPAGFCILERNRYINAWQACTWVAPELVTDMLAVLSLSTLRPIYVAIDERMYERKRWIDSLRVQSNNPADE